MLSLFLAAALSFQTPAAATADVLADAVETDYAAHSGHAAALKRMEAEGRLLSGLMAQAGLAEDDLSAFRADLEETRRAEIAAIAAGIDFESLLDRSPGAAQLAIQLLRQTPDHPERLRMLAHLERLTAADRFSQRYYDALLEGFGEEPQETPAAETPPGQMSTQETAVLGRYERWRPVVAEIAEMRGRDQFSRWLLVAAFSLELTPETRADYEARMGEFVTPIDRAHADRTLLLLERHGFDTLRSVAPFSASDAVGILHHSGDTDVMRRTLDLVEPAALAGEFNGQRYALLYDRVAEAEGRPQRYGSQDMCVDGRRDIYTLEDPDQVDAWRAGFGMPPLADYRAALLERYGEDC